MELQRLIDALARPEAYPPATETPVVVHTHISVVFLAGDYAYKIKKPVDLGFLDFTSLERRRHFCHEEVRLNRRLAPDVYLGVVPVVRRGEVLAFGTEEEGEAVEYAVRMRRLPDDRTFESVLARGELDAAALGALAARMAAFHAAAADGPEVSRWGRLATVAGNARENFAQVEPYVGETVSEGVFVRLRDLTEVALERLRRVVEERAARHVTRDTHGDLHLRHVYSLPEAAPPGDLVVVDCIEFNERFRFADPVADIAFLDMDLRFHGRPDLAAAFTDAYFAAADDDEGRALLPFYSAYRAVVRGKVDGFACREAEIPAPARERARDRARAYFLLALGVLAPPSERPALVLSTGLPGTGKSWLARLLASTNGFAPVASDRVRKELAGFAPTASAAAPVDRGIYSPEWTERTYAECLRRSEGLLFEGRRVVVDATFREEARRRAFLQLARDLCVPALVFECRAPVDVVRARIAARRDDASDADFDTYRALADRWEAYGAATEPLVRPLDTSARDGEVRAAVRQVLQAEGLA